ncbi:hypothetical protein ACW0S0_04635 [Fusobacterium polymorphum]
MEKKDGEQKKMKYIFILGQVVKLQVREKDLITKIITIMNLEIIFKQKKKHKK